MNKNLQSISPLLWVMLFDHTCLNMTFPVLTLLFFDTQSSLFAGDTSHAVRSMWYGVCVSLPHIGNIVMAPILSGLSDEFGRKKILLIGIAGALLFSLIAGLGVILGALSLVVIGLLVRGIFSRTNPIAQAVIGDMSPRDLKVRHMGYLQSAISLGAFVGPLLGGYLANRYLFSTFNFSLPFFVAAIFALVSFLLTLFVFKETLTIKKHAARWSEFNFRTIKKVFSQPDVLRISLILLLTQVSWSLYYQYIPPTLKTILHFDAHELGLFVGMVALWLMVATTFCIKWLERFYQFKQILFISLYLVLIGTVLTVVFCGLQLQGKWSLLVWVAAVPTAIGDVIAYSCITALYSNVVEKEEQGKVMGFCFIVIAFIWAVTGLVGGMMMSAHALLPLMVAPFGVVLAIRMLHRFDGSLKRLF